MNQGGPSSGRVGTRNQARDNMLMTLKLRLRENVRALMDNYVDILKLAKPEIDPAGRVYPFTQTEQDHLEMSVRAANMTRAAETLMRLVSDLKEMMILGDFCWIHESTNQLNEENRLNLSAVEDIMVNVRDTLAAELYGMEEECHCSFTEV